MPGGRPRKYDSPDKMQEAIEAYFELEKSPTICGLAIHLGFAQRKSLLDYEGYGDEFCNTIKKAKLRVEKWYEENLLSNHTTGAIFALKNFGWADKQEVNVNAGEDLKSFIDFLSARNGDTKDKNRDR